MNLSAADLLLLKLIHSTYFNTEYLKRDFKSLLFNIAEPFFVEFLIDLLASVNYPR